MSLLKRWLGRVPGSRRAYTSARHGLAWLRVTREFVVFRARSRAERPGLVPRWGERLFYLDNRTTGTPFDRHYVYHTAWAVRQLCRHQPAAHVDVSSSLYFVALGSAVVPMRHLDYRPPMLVLEDLQCTAGDLMALPFADDSVESLSCMHVVEHVGLARYGDPLDPLGDVKAAAELSRVLAVGGRLYFVTPVGRPRLCFNGHRIYDFAGVRALFPSLDLEEWALVPDAPPDGLVMNAPAERIDAQEYGCGCFLFRKAM